MPLCAEAELLLCCAGPSIYDSGKTRIRQLASRDLDWERIVATAQTEGAMPVVFENLQSHCADVTPEQIREALRQRCAGNAARN